MLLHHFVLYSVSSIHCKIWGFFFSGLLSLLLSELQRGACMNHPQKEGGSANPNFSSATGSKGQPVRNVSLTHWWELCRLAFKTPGEVCRWERELCVRHCSARPWHFSCLNRIFFFSRKEKGPIENFCHKHSVTVYMVGRPKLWERPLESSCSNEISGFSIAAAATCHPSLFNGNGKKAERILWHDEGQLVQNIPAIILMLSDLILKC